MADGKRNRVAHNFKDLTGLRFGRLSVIKRAQVSSPLAHWECHCDCGAVKVVPGNNLRRGMSKSCGCLKREQVIKNGKANKIHGLRKSPVYKSWEAMRERCGNASHVAYRRYGGRGIKVCARLARSVVDLVAVIGDRPNGMTVDRFPDKDGHYSCGDCEQCRRNGWAKNIRWATKTEQGRNRRDNQTLTHNGKTLTVNEWAQLVGLKPMTIRGRLARGWSHEKSLTTPLMQGHHP
jgi:hypothetical protein